MKEFLEKLKKNGVNPTNILDIGAERGSWSRTANSVFTESRMIMVEPIRYKVHSKFNYRKYFKRDMWEMKNCLLSDSVREVDWYERRNTGDSIYKENTSYFKNTKPTKKTTTTLDLEFKNYFQTGPEIIKIDTQGSEIPILKGGRETIKNTEIIILELPFFGEYNTGVPSFSEHILFMENLGFIPFEIVESHTFSEFSCQLDVAFIRKEHSIVSDHQNRISKLG